MKIKTKTFKDNIQCGQKIDWRVKKRWNNDDINRDLENGIIIRGIIILTIKTFL